MNVTLSTGEQITETSAKKGVANYATLAEAEQFATSQQIKALKQGYSISIRMTTSGSYAVLLVPIPGTVLSVEVESEVA